MKQGRVIINRNICDNAAECDGIRVCPTNALHWNEANKKVDYDPQSCIDCGDCANEEIGCPVGAILWGVDEADYKAKMKLVEEETMTLDKLEVDRYGAMPIKAEVDLNEIEPIIKASNGILLIEVFFEEAVKCLIKSIPYSDIIAALPEDTKIVKVAVARAADFSICDIAELPALIIIKNHNICGVVSGYFNVDQQRTFIDKILNLLKV